MENLKQSILILNFFSGSIIEKANSIYYNSAVANTENKDFDDYLFLLHLIILHTSSYLEEYDQELGVHSEARYQDRIEVVKKISKPFLKSIRQWSDMKSYRNEIAHTLRKKGKFVLLDPEYDLHKTPYNVLELLFLRNCIIQTQRILKNEFKIEFINAIDELDAIEYKKKADIKLSYENFHHEYHRVVCQSMEIALKYNKEINYDIEEGWVYI